MLFAKAKKPEDFPSLPVIRGVTLATAATGMHYKGRDDLLLIRLHPASYAAGTVTRSTLPGAPVVWSKPILKQGRAQAILINAGNANVMTGRHGTEAVKNIADRLSHALGIEPDHILQASTGVIGEKLDTDKILQAIPALCRDLREDDWQTAARAIMTTDTRPKAAYAQTDIAGRPVSIVGIAKGSGMIAPNMATMLGFIFTDAAIPPHLLAKMTKSLVNESFNAITVDGDSSTSDMVITAATGLAQNPLTDDETQLGGFTEALNTVMTDLACQIVRDGEGAKKFIRITVKGAKNDESARIIGRAIANSPLVKTALAAGDANWGRIVMAVGKSGEPAAPETLSIAIGGETIIQKGEPAADYQEVRLSKHLAGDDIDIIVDIGLGAGQGTVFTCDLTEDYLTINGSYRS